MVKLTEVPRADPAKAVAEEIAAETIQANYRRHKECQPAIKLKRINSEEKLVQDIAADVIKGGIKRSNSIKKNKIPGTPPIAKPSPRATAMAAQEAAGGAAWLEVHRIVVRDLQYKRWDDGVDPFVELNGMVKTGVLWNSRGKPLVWTKTDSVVPVPPGDNELRVRLFDANRIRDDVLIGECTVDTHSVPDMATSPTILTAQVSCPKYKDARIELHVVRSTGATFPKVDDSSIRADHRKVSVEDLDISSDVKVPRDVRDEAKRLALEAEKREASPRPPPRPRRESPTRAQPRQEAAAAPAPPRKESQPLREAKAAVEAKHMPRSASRHELPAELRDPKPGPGKQPGRRKSKARAMSPGWLEKNVEAEKRLVIDDAYNESYKKIVSQEGVHLTFHEVAIILGALGYDEAKTPAPPKSREAKEEGPEVDAPPEMDGQEFLEQGIVHIPLAESASTSEIAALFTELVNRVDFGIAGTHGNASAAKEEGKTDGATFAISNKEAKIIKEHLLSLVTGMWARNRNFILLVCGAHPDQGGGRPSNWSISWVQKLAKKLDFPEEKFMSCTGLQFLEENRNEIKQTLGIVPSLLQSRFALYQHLLRLVESWWTIPSRPSDRVDETFRATRRQTVSRVAPQGFVPYAPPSTRKGPRRRPRSAQLPGRPEVHRMTLSPTYIKKGQRADGTMEITDKLQPGDDVVIGPKLILYPVLLGAGHDNGLDVRDHMFEKYAELVAGRSAVVSVFPYGRHVYPEMAWVSLKLEDGEDAQDMSQLVKQLEKVDVTDILVSGRHVLVPEVCLMRDAELARHQNTGSETDYRKNIGNDFETIGRNRSGDKYVSKLEAEAQALLADTADSNWRDDYSDDGQLAGGLGERFPSSPEYYIGGGKGAPRAVVTAPLPDIFERRTRPSSAPSARQPPHKSMLSHVDPALRESADGQWDTLWSRGGLGRNSESPGSTLGRPRSIDDYPTPEKYLNGAKGVKKAVVIAPLEEPVPNRGNHEKLPGSPERDHSRDRLLYRPLPNFLDTVIPDSETQPRPRSSSSAMRPRPRSGISGRFEAPSAPGDHFGEAEEVLKMLSRGLPEDVTSSNMKQSVRASVDRYNSVDNQLRGSMKKNPPNGAKPAKRRNSFDPLKEPVSSRPKPEEKKKTKKKKWSDDHASARDDELLRLVETLENIGDVDELQDIQDSLAGHFRKRSAKGYGSPVRDPTGVYPDGIIDSMIKYKLNHDGDSNSAKLKMKKWGLSPGRPDAGSKAKFPDSDTENENAKIKEDDEIKAPVPLKKDKFIFPWMIGEPRTSDDIDPRKNERLWRALKLAERESAKKEAHLRRELKRLGVSDDNDMVKDPYDTYTNV